jgi:hypothetical protein
LTNPLLLDADGEITPDHGRVLEVHKLGMDNLPAITLAHLTNVIGSVIQAHHQAQVLSPEQTDLSHYSPTGMVVCTP